VLGAPRFRNSLAIARNRASPFLDHACLRSLRGTVQSVEAVGISFQRLPIFRQGLLGKAYFEQHASQHSRAGNSTRPFPRHPPGRPPDSLAMSGTSDTTSAKQTRAVTSFIGCTVNFPVRCEKPPESSAQPGYN